MTVAKKPSVLILGSGIAGLSAALKLADADFPVTIVSKDALSEGATRYAQGGIASVWSNTDSFESHINDTLEAGAGLCHRDSVEICIKEGPERVRELIDLGVEFTRESGAFDLHQEGGHGARRILHADDLTGFEIERALIAQLMRRPNVNVLENTSAVDLITARKLNPRLPASEDRCLGVYVLDSKSADGNVRTLLAQYTILATGGAGKAYLYTSNPDTATGDGIAMAYRAGARVANLEFMQFHPTCLYHSKARTFLISEALRGEGATLKTLDGQAFMKRYHPLGDLAPRDVVARAIDSEIKRTGDRHVWLDATHLSEEDVRRKFPNIDDTCRRYGIKLHQEPIPVVPAAHYTCGGVVTDLHGATSLGGLYAIGETAHTGLHGANRLASNSLLEAVVFGHRASLDIRNHFEAASGTELAATLPAPPRWQTGHAVAIEEQIDIAATWLEVRQLMWNYVGIVRSNRRLERARRRLQILREEVQDIYWNTLLTRDLVELRNLITVAELIVECAMSRKESRGLHYTVDYPLRDDRNFGHDTIL